MLHHDRWPDRKGTAGDERKTTRETEKDERVTEAKKEDKQR
jgi:hypothetical protein